MSYLWRRGLGFAQRKAAREEEKGSCLLSYVQREGYGNRVNREGERILWRRRVLSEGRADWLLEKCREGKKNRPLA